MFAIADIFCYHNIRIKVEGVDIIMEFSLEWFTSIPGLLITGGVLLLLIALIILIATSGKKKKEKKGENAQVAEQPAPSPQMAAVPQPTAQTGAAPEMNSPAVSAGNIMDIPAPVAAMPQPGVMPNQNATMQMPTTEVPPVMDPMTQPTVQQTPVVEANVVTPELMSQTLEPTPGVNTNTNINTVQESVITEPTQDLPHLEQQPVIPTVDLSAPVQEMPSIAPAVDSNPFQPMATAPIVEPTPVQEAPTIAPTIEQTPVQGIAPAIAPTVEATPIQEVSPVAPTIEQAPTIPTITPAVEQPIQQEQPVQQGPVIYGGANPIVPEINIQQPQHQIYGGANPLENTQSIPISNLVGPAQQNVVQTPTPEPTIVTPQQPQQINPVVGQTNNMGQ